MTKEFSWFLLINPAAGGGKAMKKLPEIEAALKNYGIPYTLHQTRFAGEAETLTKEAIAKGFKKFIIAGGDGSLNEVINGIMNQDTIAPEEVTITQLPVGTGNDWRRTWELPKSIDGCIMLLAAGKTILHDIGEVIFTDAKKTKSLWFINIAGIGFDAQVAYAANLKKDKGKTGLHIYLQELLKALIMFKEPEFIVKTESETYNFRGFTVLAGICKFAGNNMKLVPDANAQDRLLSAVLVEKLSKFKIIRKLPSLFSGSFIKLPEVKSFHCKELYIESNPPFFVQLDGESKGKSPIHIRMAKNQISVIIS